jgi:hypothetical protein
MWGSGVVMATIVRPRNRSGGVHQDAAVECWAAPRSRNTKIASKRWGVNGHPADAVRNLSG